MAFMASCVTSVTLNAAPQAPAPVQIQNGKVETRAGAAIDREIAAVSTANSTDPVWVAWRAPMIAGDRDMCGWYSDRTGKVRGMFVDEDFRTSGSDVRTSPQITPPTGPVPLEAGTGLVVLTRAVGGKVERLRTLSDDCPMDAGGRTVYWLSSITPAESLRFLSGLTRDTSSDRTMVDNERQIVSSAIRAIGYHANAAADGMLDALAADHTDSSVRRQAATTLGTYRGAHGAATLTRLIGSVKDGDERRSLVTALGSSREPATVDTFRSLTRDPDARIRSEAAYYFVVRGGAAVITEALKLTSSDPDDSVRKRVVTGIGRLPNNAGIPALIDLARTSKSDVVRKAAVSALSQSNDPRAIALMEEILKKLTTDN
jgi:hypothetical protein